MVFITLGNRNVILYVGYKEGHTGNKNLQNPSNLNMKLHLFFLYIYSLEIEM